MVDENYKMEINLIMSRWTIDKLRGYMKECGVDAWMVTSADYHDSEYSGEYFKERSFLSGFTGSAGTLVVTEQEAGLWTDGRYFVQAAHQLEGSGITLYKMGQKGVPTVAELLAEKLKDSPVKPSRHNMQQDIHKISESSVTADSFKNKRKVLFSEKLIGYIEISVDKVCNNISSVQE